MLRTLTLLALPLAASAAAAQSLPPAVSLSGVWAVANVPFAPWKFQLTVRGSRITGMLRQAEYDAALKAAPPIRALPIDSGSVVGSRVVLVIPIPPSASGQSITFIGVWAGDSIAFTRTLRNLPASTAPDAMGLFGVGGARQFTVRRDVPPRSSPPPTTIPPCATPAGISGRWAAPFVPQGPWVLMLCSDGERVTGLVGQGGFDRPNPPRPTPLAGTVNSCSISNGVITATQLSFDCVITPPVASRVVTFTGTIAGDSIVVQRSIRSLAGDRWTDQGGLFASDERTQFTVHRAATDGGTGFGAAAGQTPRRDSVELVHDGTTVFVYPLGSDSSRILASVFRQIDMADSAINQLPAARQAFFRRLRVAVRSTAYPLISPVGYSSSSGKVVLTPMVYAADEPKLLQVMMQAYYADQVPSGYDNTTITGLFEQAGYGRRFPQDAPLLQNKQNYFGMVGAVFLRGSAPFEPRTRERLRDLQPDMYAWLVKEFGEPR